MHQTELIIIGVSAGLALGLLLAYLVFLGFRWYKNRAHLSRCANERSMTTLPIRVHGIGVSTNFSASLSISTVGAGSNIVQKSSPFTWRSNQKKEWLASVSGIPTYNYRCKKGLCCKKKNIPPLIEHQFAAQDIQKATQNFTTILGQGSFGPVYKAVMVTGESVAVKVLASDSRQGEREFQTEVSLLGRLHHRNLVNLVGYCIDKGQRILIYEFMPNGSLANRLYSKNEQTFSWDERIQIALDIAHGIEYLHEGAVPPVIHRDLKSANILLDQSVRAKVADFGLSKEEEFDGRNSGLKGTYGYIDPEYISTNKFTTKSDIYSFGIILFELITAIHPHQNLMEYINLASMSPEGVDEILDERLAGDCSPDEVRQLAHIAQKCLRRLPRRRPSIGEVSQAIIKIKQRRLLSEDPGSFTSRDLSRVASMIEDRQVELSNMASAKEYNL